MNWDAVGAIGEVVGALAVVLTLGYLAYQIRQGSMQMRASSFQTAWTEYTSQIQLVMMNETNLAAFRAGLAAYSSCHPDVQARFHGIMVGFVRSYLIYSDLESTDMLSEEARAFFDMDMAAILSCPGGREWWNEVKGAWGPFAIGRVERALTKYSEAPALNDVLDWLKVQETKTSKTSPPPNKSVESDT